MTEDEAKTKWCPLVDVPDTTPAAAIVGATRCIGSACMAWRWRQQTHDREVELWSKSAGCRVNSAYTDDSEWRPVHAADKGEPPAAVGYCGLAGRP